MSKAMFRMIPAVTELLADADISAILREYPRNLVLRQLNRFLEELRATIRQEEIGEDELRALIEKIPVRLAEALERIAAPTLRPVINATGVIIYTNLGRAPISRKVAEEFINTICSYNNLEYDLGKGARGHRDVHFESRITRIMGCEAASVCNNAAAALMIILNTLAYDRDVIISRGELVEIGGSFRIPEILKKSGARLKEIGTTNRTFLRDYENAINPDTALILKVHSGNYQITGFTSEVGISELGRLAAKQHLPLVHDIGSGLLFPSLEKSLETEPSVQASLDAGADLVCFSGDKLLGGPQAGIIVGRRRYIAEIRKNPLMRTLRIDKVICSILDRTLIEYEMGREAQSIPVPRFISLSARDIRQRAEKLVAEIENPHLAVKLVDGFSKFGGGSVPGSEIPTTLISISCGGRSAASLERGLRSRDIPILGRIEKEKLLLDLRTVFPEQERILLAALRELK